MPDFFQAITDTIFFENPLLSAWWLFTHWGWTFFVFLAILGLYFRRLNARRYSFIMSAKYVLLAVDIPKDIVPNLRSVEQIFAHLHGTDSNPNLYEKYWLGECQRSISLEIISIDGYIQFLIRTPEVHRDLVEASIYAQYPEAEITEVEDYADKLDIEFPSDEYEMYGTEWKLGRAEYFPIMTYPNFESSLAKELADPMASLLESLSRLGNGEQVWIQVVLSPEDDENWRKRGMKEVSKILGESVSGPGHDLTYFPRQVLHGLSESLTASLVEPTALEGETAREGDKSSRIRLSPREQTVVEGIQTKVSKVAYRVKFRTLYFAPKEIYSTGKGMDPIKGALKQFTAQDLNYFDENKKQRTKIEYFFKKLRVRWRKKKILRRYKLRWNDVLSKGYMLSTDELASIYHFPTETVKAPLIRKIESRKKEPPSGLPIERPPVLEVVGESKEGTESRQVNPAAESPEKASQETGPPTNLPVGE